MRQIWNLIKQDFANGMKDHLVVYMVLAPLLLSFGISLFLPSVEASAFIFAVEKDVGQQMIDSLEAYGRIEIIEGVEQVHERVEKSDSVAGIFQQEGGMTLLLEGNEPQQVAEMYQTVMEDVTAVQKRTNVSHRSLGQESTLLNEIMTIAMVMLAMLIGGVTSGFQIVSEKDSKAIHAIGVSPLGLGSFVLARGAVATLIGLVVGLGTSLILEGLSISYFQLIAVLCLSGVLTTVIALVMGITASNQIAAIAVIKLLMPLYIALPILSLLVPERLQMLFYWLPNYWQFQALGHLYLWFSPASSFWNAVLYMFISGTVLLVLVSKVAGKQFKLR